MPAGRTPVKGDELFARASQIAPGGAAASVRLNRALGRVLYLARGDGAWIYDVDGNAYLDFCTSHGASILGHGHTAIVQSVARALEMGILCSHETEHHVALAGKVCDMVPGAEMVRLSGSGTESVMHAVRLARAVTGRDKLIKFEGHFHGYSEHVYWSTAPPADRAGPPGSPVPYCQSAGIPRELADYVVVVPFNDPDALERAIRTHRDDAAAVILEPVNYNSGCILPRPGFLEAVRQLTADNGLLLIFDEVLTAFRIAPGGAQEVYGVIPDLAILGKAIGGGLPISAIVGKRDVMGHLRPLGDAEHSGTYMGHLVPVMGALACLAELSASGVYPRLYALGDRLYRGVDDAVRRLGVRARLQYLGPRFFIYFGLDPDREVQDYRSAMAHDRAAALAFTREAAARGVYFHDYGGELAHHGFSTAHTEADIDTALEAVEGALKAIA
jgi:glutamate-1-semialdehyde 2,1-aminomutase